MSGTISGASLVQVDAAPPVPSSITGVPRQTLLQWLAQAQTALNQLMIGAAVIDVQYSEGQGHRSVRYRPTDVAKLKIYIAELNQALGFVSRRSLRPGF